MAFARSAPLTPRTERLVLYKMAQGTVAPDRVRAEELSKVGQVVYAAIVQLSKADKLPAKASTLELAATESFGGELADVRPYLQRMVKTGEQYADADPADTLESVREQRLGQELTNLVWEQLGKTGRLDIGGLVAILHSSRESSKLVAGEVLMKAGVPKEETGPELKALPRISRAMGGVQGRIVLGGLPNIGKTPLAWQIAVEYSAYGKRPVLWYDIDDTGQRKLLWRNYLLHKKDKAKAARAMRKIYIRDTIAMLDYDLIETPGALVVVDSFQRVPLGNAKDRRLSLDGWLNRFVQAAKRGHPFILLSEVSRPNYGEARLSAMKETGEIEYAGTFLAQLTQKRIDDPIQFHVVKNRHREKVVGETYGHVTDLVAMPGKWRAKEIEVYDKNDEEDDE